MDREQMEARLAQLQAEHQRAQRQVEEWSRTTLRLEGGITELQFLLALDAEDAEELQAMLAETLGGDAE